MADDVKILGADEIIERFGNLADTEAMKRAVAEACKLVVRCAIQNVKKGEGELQRSIAFEVQDDGGEIVGVVYTPLDYAPYVEYGTGLFAENGDGRTGYWVFVKDNDSTDSKKVGKSYTLEEAKRVMAIMREKGLEAFYTNGQHPQPFLRPALHDNREQIKRILKGGLNNA